MSADKTNVMRSLDQKKIKYKFDDSYCQPKFFSNSIMIIIGLHADNKP